jgi:esterase/lipase superfamily enzyme
LSHVLFEQFVNQLQASAPDMILHIVAHSMGNRMVIDFLDKRSERALSPELGEIHLVRSDSSVSAFLMQQWKLFRGVSKAYVYISDNDSWLSWSERLGAGIPRLGKPGQTKWMTTSNDIEEGPSNRYLIDISQFKGPMRFNHQIPFELIGLLHKSDNPTELTDWKLERVEKNNRYPNVLRLLAPGSICLKITDL